MAAAAVVASVVSALLAGVGAASFCDTTDGWVLAWEDQFEGEMRGVTLCLSVLSVSPSIPHTLTNATDHLQRQRPEQQQLDARDGC